MESKDRDGSRVKGQYLTLSGNKQENKERSKIMGLDNYASRNPKKIDLSEEDVRAFEEAGIDLCGGVASDGEASFRGKVYDELITSITGVSLYNDWISPKTVKRMSEMLDKYDPEKVKNDSNNWCYKNTPNEVKMLQKFFRICAERGIGIVAWS